MTKSCLVKAMVFPVLIYMWVLDHKESWALKTRCCWTVVLEKTLESPLECKEIKSVNPKRHQSWIFFGRPDAEAGIPLLWPLNGKNWLIGKDPDAGQYWRQEEKVTTRDGWMASPTWCTWVWEFPGSCWGTEKPDVLQSHGVTKNEMWLSDWSEHHGDLSFQSNRL